MLQIDIVGIDPINGQNLLLEIGGQPNPGKSWVKKAQDVLWRVKDKIDVETIEGIKPKEISGNNNIFSSNPPQPMGGNKKIWRAKVNTNAVAGDILIYNIIWKKKGETNTRTYDPILSIRPIRAIRDNFLIPAGTLLTGALLVLSIILAIMLYQSKKEIKELKQPVQTNVPVQ